MDCRFGLTSFNFDFGAFANTLGLRADWSPVASKGFPTMPLPKIDVASLPHLAEQIERILSGEDLVPFAGDQATGDSRLYLHPTLWEYLRRRVVDGVR